MIPSVVITGLGVVSPNGIGKEAFCLALLAGKSGVKRISRFDPSSLPVHIAGEIPEFNDLAGGTPRDANPSPRFVPLPVPAPPEPFKDAAFDPPPIRMQGKRRIDWILRTAG